MVSLSCRSHYTHADIYTYPVFQQLFPALRRQARLVRFAMWKY